MAKPFRRNEVHGTLLTVFFKISLTIESSTCVCETATRAGLTLAVAGFVSNLIVYLINEFNVNSIDAAQTYNVVNGCMALFPLFVAVIADTFLGCFNVIWISALISLMVRFFMPSVFRFFFFFFLSV